MQGTLRTVIVAGLMAAALPAWAEKDDLPGARETLRLSIEEWLREDAAYRAGRGAAKTSAAEAEEHAGFVAGLRVRVLEECENVRRLGGEEAIRGFVCTPASGEARPPVRVAPGSVLTEDEKRAAVQARLNQLEGDIDDNLQKRQQDIRQKAGAASARAAAGGGAGAGGGGAGSGAGASGAAGGGTSSAAPGSTWGPPPPEGGSKAGDKGQPGGGGERTTSSGSTSLPGSANTGLPANSGRSAERQAPRDGGSDDDVVARQLREAAEKETDPVLKEKLWDEYRKYKEGKR